jgi:hypothetical protein
MSFMNGPGMSEATSPYLSIVVMLAESYALGAAWSLGMTISYSVNDPSRYLFEANDGMIQVCDLPVTLMVSDFTHLRRLDYRLLSYYLPCCKWKRMDKTDRGKTGNVTVEPYCRDYY